MHPLDGPRLKLRRAEQHLNAVKAAIDEFINSQPYTIGVEADMEPPSHVVVARAKQIAPSEEVSVIIGDFAHNARSALDLLIYQLSAVHLDDERHRRRLQFPICDTYETVDGKEGYRVKIKSNLRLVPCEYVTIIEGFQPYKGPNGPDSDALGILAAINDADKHRIIHVVGTVVSYLGLLLSGPGRIGNINVVGSGGIRLMQSATMKMDGVVIYRGVGDGVITKDRTIVGEFPQGIPSQVQMDMHPEAKVTVQFAEGDARVKGRPVVDTLTFIYDRVKEVVERFEYAFPK